MNSICDPSSDICDIYGIIKYIWIDVGKEEHKRNNRRTLGKDERYE